MNVGKFSSVITLLLVGVVLIALLLMLSARATRTDLGQTPPSPQPTQSPPYVDTATPLPTYVTATSLPITVVPYSTFIPRTPHVFPTANPTEVALQDYINYAFYEQPGIVIAQGSNTTPVSHSMFNYSLTTYWIEEVTLTQTVTRKLLVPNATYKRLETRMVTFNKLWRLTVTGGPFITNDMGWSIWIDDIPAGHSLEGWRSLTTLLFDGTLLREGARIGVTPANGSPPYESGYLRETLHLNRAP